MGSFENSVSSPKFGGETGPHKKRGQVLNKDKACEQQALSLNTF